MPSIASPRSWTPRAVPAWALAAVAARAYLVLAPPSADLAAQDYRADLGLVLWDNGWYGGHHMPGYSVLFPPLAALLGPAVVGALSAVAAAWLFERLVRDTDGGARGLAVVRRGDVSTLISGRLTFALGVAVGLAAVLAAARGRAGWACALAALASLASPVAARLRGAGRRGVVAGPPALVAGGARGVRGRARRSCSAIAFPEGGSFPFVASSFWPALAAAIAVGLVVPPRGARACASASRSTRVAIVASFALATPMGGNVVRLGALFAGPVLAALVWRTNRRALALLALPLVYWQWVAPVDDWARAAGDASVHERYYDGLLGFLGAQRGGPFRVEIPFTDNHWESRWVAPHVPLARGWERQVDRQRNALFYDESSDHGGALPPLARRQRGALRRPGRRADRLLGGPRGGSSCARARPYLREVWHDAHWRVFAVAGARPLAGGAARVTAIEPERVRLTASRPGLVDLRVRFTPYWRIATGRGCVGQGPGGWTRLRLERPGPVVVETSFALGRVRASAPRCTD